MQSQEIFDPRIEHSTTGIHELEREEILEEEREIQAINLRTKENMWI